MHSQPHIRFTNIILWITMRFSTSASASEEDSPWAGAIRRDSTPSFSARRRSLSAFLCCSTYSKIYIVITFSKQSSFYWSKLHVSIYTLIHTWSKQSWMRSSMQNTDIAAYKILIIKTEWIRPFLKLRHRWEDNTEKDINRFFSIVMYIFTKFNLLILS